MVLDSLYSIIEYLTHTYKTGRIRIAKTSKSKNI